MQSVMEKSRQFFSLPLKDKLTVGDREGSSGYRGYFGIGMEDLENKDGTRDLVKEEGDAKQIKGDQ
jgi:isopenicillin N synthase-like dioxygenase